MTVSGQQLDMAVWGEDDKEFTASMIRELRERDVQLAAIRSGEGERGAWISSQPSSGAAAQSVGRAVAKEGAVVAAKLVGNAFGIPL